MSILSVDDYVASVKQKITLTKTASLTTVAANYGDPIAQAGQPGAGTLAGTSTTAGVVPTDGTAGFPLINNFAGGALGYLSNVDFSSPVACRIRLVDFLWKAGAYAFNASQALSAQPSYSGRVPGGTDFTGTELWLEAVTAFTGNATIAVTYTDQSGNPGHTTGTIATGIAPIIGRMIQIPLASGDSGIQKVENIVSTISTVGTFNMLVLRPLWEGNIRVANGGDVHDFLRTGMPQVFDSSALGLIIAADSTASSIPSILIEIASK